jgi:hypothetical protein
LTLGQERRWFATVQLVVEKVSCETMMRRPIGSEEFMSIVDDSIKCAAVIESKFAASEAKKEQA